jgi:hypothetical protein
MGATTASIALTVPKTFKAQILELSKPRCIPGEIYKIVWGDFPHFDQPDWEEYLIFCHGFQLAFYSPIFMPAVKKRLKPGELLYHLHPVSHLHDSDYEFVSLTDTDINQLALFELFNP